MRWMGAIGMIPVAVVFMAAVARLGRPRSLSTTGARPAGPERHAR
jgi:hypothetical protein